MSVVKESNVVWIGIASIMAILTVIVLLLQVFNPNLLMTRPFYFVIFGIALYMSINIKKISREIKKRD